MPQIINVNGQSYEIENWEEFSEKLLTAIGFQVESEIVRQINELRLVDTGHFKQSFTSEVQGTELVITSSAPYAVYLEYGTYDYWKAFGLENFPETPDQKKKDLPREQARKLPRGMQPFAPVRRVLYNQKKMGRIIETGAKLASR